MKTPKIIAALALLTAVMTAGCAGKQKDTATEARELFPDETRHATLLSLRSLGNGATLVDITNPWDTSAFLASYLLLADSVRPDSVPRREKLTEINVPLRRSAVFSAVHGGAVNEIGAADQIAAVADAEYFKGVYASRIAAGSITDIGSSSAPSLEKIALVKPDAFLVSPFENAGHGALESSGIPILEMADYMESTPLGRAEWIRLIGLLYGRQAEADSVFAYVEARYNALASKASKLEKRPKVLTEMLTSGYWFVPGGNSYMARLISDAGGEYPWAGDKSSGSLQLDFSAVYARAADADIWLIKTYGSELSLASLREVYPLNSQIKAFKHKGVYAADTKVVPLFEEFPFHPELLLEEYAAIFSANDSNLRYFKRVR